MAELLKKFGRYFLLDQIAQGGMAEIYRARLGVADGGGRLLVIKCIQAAYGENHEFLQMFKSEIKVTMGFSHPNIVQLYDFGEENKQPFIAMEFVDGKNLRQYLSRFGELKQAFPVELATHIIEQAASALHYAHTFKDKITGQSMNIVHRDVSPQNILISYEGNVKVIDFGIAKASTNSESTRAGIIKGKPSYLSPEQISGEELDGRSDLFALGIVLWELLAGKKLFAGESDLAVLKQIESVNSHVKPPSSVNPKVPKELDYIVLRALAKQREKRFQTGEELQRALHKFLYAFSPDFNPGDVSYYAKDLFKNDIVEDRKKTQKLNEKAEILLASALHDSLQSSENSPPTQLDPSVESTRMAHPSKPSSFTPENQYEMKKDDRPVKLELQPSSSLRTTRTAPPLPGVATSASQARSFTRSFPGTSKNINSDASSEKNAERNAKIKKLLVPVAAVLALAIFGPEFGVRIPILSDLFDSQPQHSNTAKKEAKMNEGSHQETNAPTGTAPASSPAGSIDPKKPSVPLVLKITPEDNVTLTINGQPLTSSNTFVPLDTPLEIAASRPGYKTRRTEFAYDSKIVATNQEQTLEIHLEPEHPAYLTLRTTPSADMIIITEGSIRNPASQVPIVVSQQKWSHGTPLEDEMIPAGKYTLLLKNTVLGMQKQIQVEIEEGQRLNLNEKLEVKN